ncbi:MAG: TetR/AcrR family transcriptional regulator [Sciscionella sp.]
MNEPTQPQQERSRATRRRLLEAAVDRLAELGWTGTTVAVVAKAAGVSRGAAQHHFPTREDLIAAAVEHVTEVRLAEVTEFAAALPSSVDRIDTVVRTIVTLYTGPVFRAALHLWVAASTEDSLREQVLRLEGRVGRAAHRATIDLLGVQESTPGVRETVQATLDLARGLGLATVLADDSARREPIVRQWVRMLESTLPRPQQHVQPHFL